MSEFYYLLPYPNDKKVKGANRYLNVNGRWSSFPSKGVPLLCWDDETSCREASEILLKSRYDRDGSLCAAITRHPVRRPGSLVKYDHNLHIASLKGYI